MGRYLENFCVGPCPQGCMGPACRNYGDTTVYVCDDCGTETTNPEDWEIGSEDLCPHCLAKREGEDEEDESDEE